MSFLTHLLVPFLFCSAVIAVLEFAPVFHVNAFLCECVLGMKENLCRGSFKVSASSLALMA